MTNRDKSRVSRTLLVYSILFFCLLCAETPAWARRFPRRKGGFETVCEGISDLRGKPKRCQTEGDYCVCPDEPGETSSPGDSSSAADAVRQTEMIGQAVGTFIKALQQKPQESPAQKKALEEQYQQSLKSLEQGTQSGKEQEQSLKSLRERMEALEKLESVPDGCVLTVDCGGWSDCTGGVSPLPREDCLQREAKLTKFINANRRWAKRASAKCECAPPAGGGGSIKPKQPDKLPKPTEPQKPEKPKPEKPKERLPEIPAIEQAGGLPLP